MEQQNESSVWIIVAIVAAFVVIFGWVIYSKVKRRNAQWSGTVIDKSFSETEAHRSNNQNNNTGGFSVQMGDRRAINRSYSLRIRDTTSKEFNWPVGEGVYASVDVGDQLQKNPGTETPVVVSRAVQTPVQSTYEQPAPAATPPTPPNPPTSVL